MPGPQYIRLTAVRILQPKPKGNVVEMLHTVLQPPVAQLLPLPAAFNCAQQDGRTEHDRGNMVVVYQELFADVLQAIEDAAHAGRCIAIPMNATQLASAVAAALPKFPMPVKAGEMFDKGAFADKAVQQFEEMKRDALKAHLDKMKGQREKLPEDTPKNTAEEEVAGAVKVVQAADEIAQRWGDFVQTDGENTGAATAVKLGDLCVMAHQAQDAGVFLVFIAEKSEEDGFAWCWSRDTVPPELRGHYVSEDDARQAVRLAGYGRRLVEVK
jgi:hypothetical protein